MKTVYIVFYNPEKVDTWKHLYEDLCSVLDVYVRVKLCFLTEIEPGEIDDGDLFLVLYKDRVYPMQQYISSLDKVIILARTFQQKYMEEVYALPDGANVLVVNDSEESTIQTTNSLYELGLNHLNLIPYLPSEGEDKYAHLRVAITPEEEDFVPPYINKVINVHERCIDANTFVTILNKLNLNHREITRNLLDYIQKTAGNMGNQYINDRIKDQLLEQTIQEDNASIIIVDKHYHTVHFNDKAAFTFQLVNGNEVSLETLFESIFQDLFTPEDYTHKVINFQDAHYVVTKKTIRVLDQIIGYSLRFHTESEIKNLEIDVNKQLMKKGLVAKYHFEDILYQSQSMEKCVDLAKKIALTHYTVLISGESGTGKELFAQSIHNFSARKDQPFVAINCAALPETLLESELFGYEKGAFTGAAPQGKIGLFERANRGTIFLDEIGDMSLPLQTRLLRVLQEKQITRIGSDRVINLDIRILAATNKDLSQAVQHNGFRKDLYYRLCNIPLDLPPLHQRGQDALYVFQHFVGEKFCKLTEEEKAAICQYRWPGNLRELQNAADYYKMMEELPQAVLSAQAQPGSQSLADGSSQGLAAACGAASIAPANIADVVLGIVTAHTTDYSGIGRSAILHQLSSYGIHLSDDKLRKLLHRLEAEGQIRIGRGRTGCMRV